MSSLKVSRLLLFLLGIFEVVLIYNMMEILTGNIQDLKFQEKCEDVKIRNMEEFRSLILILFMKKYSLKRRFEFCSFE